MTNSDLGRLLKAFEIQSVLRAPMYVEINLSIEFSIFLNSNLKQKTSSTS